MSITVTKVDKEYRKTLDALAAAFGASGWELKKTACTGKWSGTFDYSIHFSDGRMLFLGNGQKRAQDGALEKLNQINYFNANAAKNALECAETIKSVFPGAESISAEVVPYDMKKDLCVWACLTFQWNGIKWLYRETGMHYALCGTPCDGKTAAQRLAGFQEYIKNNVIPM